MIQAVLWDFGGVLTTSPFDAFNRFEAETRHTEGFHPRHQRNQSRTQRVGKARVERYLADAVRRGIRSRESRRGPLDSRSVGHRSPIRRSTTTHGGGADHLQTALQGRVPDEQREIRRRPRNGANE